jgi:proton-dependent oligopeptide transporter, POT family
MKALVMSMFLFMNALSSALAEILTPAIKDPHLIWVWAGPAIALFVQTCVFWWRYRWMNNDEYMLEDDATTLPPSDTKSGLEPTDSEPRGHPEKKNEL